jgi:hypothetical protein
VTETDQTSEGVSMIIKSFWMTPGRSRRLETWRSGGCCDTVIFEIEIIGYDRFVGDRGGEMSQ